MPVRSPSVFEAREQPAVVALYTPKSRPKPEVGPFADSRYERLGAVGVPKLVTNIIRFEGVGYRFSLFENPHAQPTAALPPELGSGGPATRHPGA